MKLTFQIVSGSDCVEVGVERDISLEKMLQIAKILFPENGRVRIKQDSETKWHYEINGDSVKVAEHDN